MERNVVILHAIKPVGYWYHCFSRRLKIYLVVACNKNSVCTISLNVSESKEWVPQYKNIWNEVEPQLFEKLTTGLMKGEGRYVHGKLKTWKERIKANIDGQNIPYDMYCSTTAVLKIDSVSSQDKNHPPQVYVEECKYTDAENRQCNKLSNNDYVFFEV